MTATVAIIVPVLGRPEHAKTFLESLRATTPKSVANVYAITEATDDARKAWPSEWRYQDLNNEAHTFADKVVIGYHATHEPYVLLVGSDVVFKDHWYQSAMKVADRTGAGVIATNDLGNPRVMAGTHATHPLISRRYVEEKGGSWDGPGHIVHTGYKHNFVDDEWSVKAKLDGEFAFASRSIIEHNHVAWGKAPDDWVYRKGQESFEQDRDLFLSRLRTYTHLLDGTDA